MARRHIEYVVVRDSSDRGLDRGMQLFVVPGTKDRRVDFDVPALDTRIAGVRVPHPDLRLVTVEARR